MQVDPSTIFMDDFQQQQLLKQLFACPFPAELNQFSVRSQGGINRSEKGQIGAKPVKLGLTGWLAAWLPLYTLVAQ